MRDININESDNIVKNDDKEFNIKSLEIELTNDNLSDNISKNELLQYASNETSSKEKWLTINEYSYLMFNNLIEDDVMYNIYE